MRWFEVVDGTDAVALLILCSSCLAALLTIDRKLKSIASAFFIDETKLTPSRLRAWLNVVTATPKGEANGKSTITSAAGEECTANGEKGGTQLLMKGMFKSHRNLNSAVAMDSYDAATMVANTSGLSQPRLHLKTMKGPIAGVNQDAELTNIVRRNSIITIIVEGNHL